MIDSHNHSTFSHDGKASVAELAARAKELGMEYYAITEHLDRDYKFLRTERFCRQLNLKKAYAGFQKVKALYEGSGMYLAFGVECGFSAEAVPVYQRELAGYDFDVIINSIHTIYGGDAYFGKFYQGKAKEEVYAQYLRLLKESVCAPYPYDIVGHIGYITRYVPYSDPSMCFPSTIEGIDELLRAIIERGKTIECNTHIKDSPFAFLPETAILKRYRELGGDNITFSSDAHRTENVGDKYFLVASAVKELGFKEWTVYKKRVPHKVPIE